MRETLYVGWRSHGTYRRGGETRVNRGWPMTGRGGGKGKKKIGSDGVWLSRKGGERKGQVPVISNRGKSQHSEG